MNSENTSNTPPHQSTQMATDVWYISFGDLLTLLLCFFLVLTPWEKLRLAADTKAKQDVSALPRDVQQIGTELAEQTADVRSSVVAEVPIYAEHISSDDISSSTNLTEMLHQELAPHLHGAASVIVAVCDTRAQRPRVLALVGRLIQGLAVEQVNVGIEVASDCNYVEILRPTTAKPVGVISVRGV